MTSQIRLVRGVHKQSGVIAYEKGLGCRGSMKEKKLQRS